MLNITNDALDICTATVRQLAGAQVNSKCLRIILQESEISISFEIPRNTDEIVHRDGMSVLAVPDDVADEFAGKTLDVANDGRFTIS
jgi:hypothetical protein